jgi:hypothetical protein
VTERALPIGTTYGHSKAQLSDVIEPVENDDVAAFNAHFASGAIGTFSVSRIATGHANCSARGAGPTRVGSLGDGPARGALGDPPAA